jgi:beta-1,4-N-acetylglucosaminyltransferase
MIFVTVGTGYFDELVLAMDQIASSLEEPVIAQIGEGSYKPQSMEFFKFTNDIQAYYRQASMIISHGGAGTLSEVLQLNKPIIAVADPHQPDNHQEQILRIWSEKKYLVWCKDLSTLQSSILEARTGLQPYQLPDNWIHTIIRDFLDGKS